MKTTIFKSFQVKIILYAALLCCMSCRDVTDELIRSNAEEDISWQELLNKYPVGPGIVVQQHASIQEAIEQADPGEVIYIEPGIYREKLTFGTQPVTLLGLGTTSQDPVIIENPEADPAIDLPSGTEIHNIQVRNYQITLTSTTGSTAARKLQDVRRDDLGKGIAHYQFEIRVGEGTFDYITLHRVVKESSPFDPVPTDGDVFMVHGASQNFEDIFLVAGATEINEETSAPFYLATANLDVWGIDLGWTNVPLNTSDFGFMEDWGLARDIDHTIKAMSIARVVRGITGQSFSKMNLLGYSYGVGVAYGAAGLETQRFRFFRNIKGIIPVDGQLKFEDVNLQDQQCFIAAAIQNEINSGNYALPQGAEFIGLGQAVLADPDGTTLAAPLTNIQFLSAVATDRANGQHFLGGTPFELNYTDPFRFARLAANLNGPYMPNQAFYDAVASRCPTLDPAYDDQLGQIDLPILNISAQGGSGPLGDYTSTLTQTTDYTLLNIDDPEQPTELDFGHADLWMAEQAPAWVWEPLRNWLVQH